MQPSQTKGKADPAFRYFVFILSLCVFLFVFLISRLLDTRDTRPEQQPAIVPVFRIEMHAHNVHETPDLLWAPAFDRDGESSD